MPQIPIQYQVGGSLAANSPYYVERPADALLYKALVAGDFCYVLNSRQMGKSSLLVRTKYHLEQQGIRCVALDLTGIGGTTSTPEQWYKGILLQIYLGLKLSGLFPFKLWWQDHADLPLAQRMALFIREILVTYLPDQPIVIFFDEIDTVLSLPFPSDDFFALIRFCYNQRSMDSHYNYITFALFGVASPVNLIQDSRCTPFNIGQAIPLTGFSLEQIDPLMGGFQIPPEFALDILKEILRWTEGQPFLTQKLCQIVEEHLPQVLNESMFHGQPQYKISQPFSTFVADLVQSKIIDNWESQDTPEHLLTIAKRLLANPHMAGRLLGIYQRILTQESIKFDHTPEHIELLLSGLVVNQNERLKTKNRIYQSVFDLRWVTHKLEQHRPYAPQLDRWLSSQQQPNYLLKGLALKEALAWSRDKQLSDLDYRFLGTSQELANQFTEQKLADEKQEREMAELMVRSLQTATQVFAQARQTARKQVQTAKLGRWWIGGIAMAVTAGVLLLRLLGLLQGFEWIAFDQMIQRRPGQEIDPRITIVTIDEPDIKAAGSYPLSGQVLADCLQVLNRYQPRGIGLDIYRDVPVEPGHEALLAELANSPHLIGIEQVIESSISALPVLVNQGRVGFGDQIVDGDGIIRRTLLSISAEDDTAPNHLSFALQLTLNYLAAEGITPILLENGWNQLGQVTLKPFEPNTSGFYVGAEDGGYQLLLNYHGPLGYFQHVSMTDVLSQHVDPDLIRDRIVLIGFTAESINDLFPSPYSNRIMGSAEPMAGITIHANSVSQLLGAALEGRPLLHVWAQSWEWLWIAGWAIVGAVLTWRIRHLGGQVMAIAIAATSLLTITIIAFAQGWWIPLVPALLTLTGTAIILPIATARNIETLQLHQTMKLLHEVMQTDPLVGKIAIAYLKQVEGQEPTNIALIEKYLNLVSSNLEREKHPQR